MFATNTHKMTRFTAVLAAGLGVSAAPAATYHVCPDGSGHFTTIQAAIDAAADWDTIVLCSATYTGAPNQDLNYRGKIITVEPATGNPEDCIIDCQGLGRGFWFQSDEDLNSVLRGVTIRNGVAPGGLLSRGGGILCGRAGLPPAIPPHHGSPTIEDCIIEDNTAAMGGGLACIEGSDPMVLDTVFRSNSLTVMGSSRFGGGAYCLESSPTFVDCTFVENTTHMGIGGASGGGAYVETSVAQFHRCVFVGNSAYNGGGLAVNEADPLLEECLFYRNTANLHGGGMYTYGNLSTPTATNCTFYENSASYGGGVTAASFSHPAFVRSIITMCSDGEAAYCVQSGQVTITCCDVYGNAGGPGFVASQIGSNNNFSAYPGFCSPSAEDFTIRSESLCAPANSPCGQLIGALGVGCGGPMTFFVCPTGPTDFRTIQSAIDGCLDGDTIELCDATFTGDGNRDLDYTGKALTVQSASNDPASCVIDCQGTQNAPHRGFFFHSGETAGSVLRGVTITGGYVVDWYGGGAIWCDDGSSPTITNCVLRNNQTTQAGGGMACSYGSSPTIDGCVIAENSSVSHGGGLVTAWDSPLHITNTIFIDNVAQDDGGGLAAFSFVEVEDCTFDHNTTAIHGGGATLMGDAVGSVFRRCMFVDNVADLGGGFSAYADNVLFDYSTFHGNSAMVTGGGGHAPGAVSLVNGTFYGNIAPTGSALDAGGTADHTILAFNNLGPAVLGPLTITCSDVFGNAAGPGTVAPQIGLAGNIALDPIFCDAPNDDFTIRRDSPCAPFSPPNPQCGLIGAWPIGCAPPCPEDVNGDTVVNVLDLLAVLAAWGQTGGPEDVNGDGIVNVLDLLAVLAAWGPCP